MINFGLFHASRVASVLAIGSFSLGVAVVDFARRRKVSSVSPSIAVNRAVGAVRPSPPAERQSLAPVDRVARLSPADRTSPSLRLAAFLPLPRPSARDQRR